MWKFHGTPKKNFFIRLLQGADGILRAVNFYVKRYIVMGKRECFHLQFELDQKDFRRQFDRKTVQALKAEN